MTENTSIAETIRVAVERSGKPFETISEEAEMSPGVLRHLCKGTIKLPINPVSSLADALGLDKRELIVQVINEYMPETWNAIRETLLEDRTEGICK